MRIIPGYVLALLISAAPSCSDLGNSPESIATPKDRWQAYHLHDYSIVQARSCFCPQSGIQKLIVVKSDTIASVADMATGSPVPPTLWTSCLTVSDLFQQIGSFDASTYSYQVVYDPLFGIPVKLSVHLITQATDAGGYSYETHLVRP